MSDAKPVHTDRLAGPWRRPTPEEVRGVERTFAALGVPVTPFHRARLIEETHA